MKFLFLFLVLASSQAFTKETYECDFIGLNSQLIFEDDQTIHLSGPFKSYTCEKSYVYFPGTELEMPTLQCQNTHDKIEYYFTQMDEETIILSGNIVFSRDTVCKKK